MQDISIMGSGFSCIDIIKRGQNISYNLGGTAANVLCILAQLDMNASLLVPHYGDQYANYFIEQLRRQKVKVVEFKHSKLATPRIIEHCESNGKHTFETVCPICGTNLNQIALPTAADIRRLDNHIWDGTNAFFFDRISEGIKIGIQQARAAHAWVCYEPNSCRQYSSFYKNISQVDIAKFSEDRVPVSYANRLLHDLDESCQTKLIIISRGASGLKFSIKSDNGKFVEWTFIKGNPLNNLVDTSGAGDWLTAAFLVRFLKEFENTRDRLPPEVVTQFLRDAQQIAARSCLHVGAHGIFKSMDDVAFLSNYYSCKIPLLTESELEISEKHTCEYCLTSSAFQAI